MSAATLVELRVVIEAKTGPAGSQLLGELMRRVDVRIVEVDESIADEAVVAWRRFGKGRHKAGLNCGDTFSYALARRLSQPLLFVGDDFSETDIVAV